MKNDTGWFLANETFFFSIKFDEIGFNSIYHDEFCLKMIKFG